MTMTDETQVEPPLPPPRGSARLRRPCFSGDGRMTGRRWAPGADTRYRERLRNAYARKRRVPDPWIIAETTGREDTLPEGWEAWPTLEPMEVAKRLDAERVEADPFVDSAHWQDWLTFTERKQAERAAARAAEDAEPSAHRIRSEREASEQAARPKRHAQGSATLDPESDEHHRVMVVDLADRFRLIVRKLDDSEDVRPYLIFDRQFESDQAVDLDADSAQASPTGREGE